MTGRQILVLAAALLAASVAAGQDPAPPAAAQAPAPAASQGPDAGPFDPIALFRRHELIPDAPPRFADVESLKVWTGSERDRLIARLQAARCEQDSHLAAFWVRELEKVRSHYVDELARLDPAQTETLRRKPMGVTERRSNSTPDTSAPPAKSDLPLPIPIIPLPPEPSSRPR